MIVQNRYDLGDMSYQGLSTDPKPTEAPEGAVFLEMDTGNVYMYQSGGEVKLSTHIAAEDWSPNPGHEGQYFTGTGKSTSYFTEDGLWFDWNGVITYNPRYSDMDVTYYVPEGTTYLTAPYGIILGADWMFGSTTVEDVDVVITTGNAGWKKL